mmetsp:Transcript_38434/g.101820  ORF Transcript_38434/g.101820 Transcript_38434/m.101820 type:complete len:232 (+) Transcript_38434:249-944(+)
MAGTLHQVAANVLRTAAALWAPLLRAPEVQRGARVHGGRQECGEEEALATAMGALARAFARGARLGLPGQPILVVLRRLQAPLLLLVPLPLLLLAALPLLLLLERPLALLVLLLLPAPPGLALLAPPPLLVLEDLLLPPLLFRLGLVDDPLLLRPLLSPTAVAAHQVDLAQRVDKLDLRRAWRCLGEAPALGAVLSQVVGVGERRRAPRAGGLHDHTTGPSHSPGFESKSA